jgi:hypothetical protein
MRESNGINGRNGRRVRPVAMAALSIGNCNESTHFEPLDHGHVHKEISAQNWDSVSN